jgi:hypothetical protein
MNDFHNIRATGVSVPAVVVPALGKLLRQDLLDTDTIHAMTMIFAHGCDGVWNDLYAGIVLCEIQCPTHGKHWAIWTGKIFRDGRQVSEAVTVENEHKARLMFGEQCERPIRFQCPQETNRHG